MIYLSWLYVVVLAVWAASEVIGQIKERMPTALVAAELIVQVLLILGVSLHITVGSIPSVWQATAYPLVFCVFALRGYGVKNEEYEVSDTREQRLRLGILNVAVTFLLLAPAVYHISTLVGGGSRLSLILASLCAFAGEAVGLVLPRLPSRFASSNERLISEWTGKSQWFGRIPDRMEFLDDKVRQWPGIDVEQPTQLFKVYFGDACHVGGTIDPVCFCIPEPVPAGIDAEQAFEHCRRWFADKLSRALIKSAAGDMPEEFQRLVEEALSDKAANSTQPASAGDVYARASQGG